MIREYSAYSTYCWLAFSPGSGDLFVVVTFDALAQASDFQIERRQVVFLYWMQDIALKWKALPWIHWPSPHRSPEPGKLIPMPSSHHRSAKPMIYMATKAGYQPQEPDVVILAESQMLAIRMWGSSTQWLKEATEIRGPIQYKDVILPI